MEFDPGKQILTGRSPVSVHLDDLDEGPGPYTMSFGFDPGPLRESIREIGLVNPPGIAREGEGRMEIVFGYRRVLALKQLGWSKVTCEDVSSALQSPLERLLFAFHENRASRPFNAVEKAMILSRLEPLLAREVILKRLMPLLSLPSHEDTLSFYVQIAAMKQEMREAIAAGSISLKAVKSLAALKPGSAELAFQCIQKLNLNFNQQLQFLDVIIDIAEMKGTDFSRILGSESMGAVLEEMQLNRPQKARRIMEELRSLRYPRLKKAEKRFEERLNRLSLPQGTRIEHPVFFEAPGYRLQVEFRNGEDLADKLRRLSMLGAVGEFGDPAYDDD